MNKTVFAGPRFWFSLLSQSRRGAAANKDSSRRLLHSGSAAPPPASLKALPAEGLADLGYIEGKSILIGSTDSPSTNLNAFPNSASELLGLKVDVIVTSQTPSVQAIQKVSSTIPIVFGALSFPIGNGIIASFARPGRNATGMTVLSEELNGKRLELLKRGGP